MLRCFLPPASPLSLLLLIGILSAAVINAQSRPPSPLNAMDHGPFVTSTISTDPQTTRSVFVHKGIAVKVGADRDAVMVFDTDLLRMASAWTGGFLKWYPARDGLQEWPSPDGFTHFSTSQRPGWSLDGNFSDSRPWRYGPIPREQGTYRGLHLHDDRVVFSYSLASTDVLESPGFSRASGQPIFDRILNLGPYPTPLSLHVLESPDGEATSLDPVYLSPSSGYVQIRTTNQTRLVGFRGLPAGTTWSLNHRHLVLTLPPHDQSANFALSIGPIQSDPTALSMLTHLRSTSADLDLSPLTQPGRPRWETLETPLVAGTDDGPFVVDELTVPADNPWHSFLRFADVDFMTPDRAVLASLSGDIWLVDGLKNASGPLHWKRFATGLYQPHGVKVVDGKIYVTARDQITRLHDENGDDEADFYENFNNEVMAGTNFHAFTLNLETDSKGNFYFAKATPWPPVKQGVKAEVTPHHGALFRLSPDGRDLEVIAHGLRNPNGLTIGPNDEILYSDNEGNWVPTSKIHRIREDGFHGFVPSSHRDTLPTDFEKPILWLPQFVDNSPSAPTFITSPTWPAALQNQLLLTSYGRGNLSLVLREEVDGQEQGAHLNLPLKFQSGTLRSRFHSDGHLYVAGLTSWQSVGHGGDWGSFHRVRYTGAPLHLPVAVNTSKGALEIRFNEPLDPTSALDPTNYIITQWTYPWTSQYGTRGQVYSVDRPGETGADPVTIKSIELSPDGQTVRLSIPSLRQDLVQTSLGVLPHLPEMIDAFLGLVMAIDYRLQSADGTPMDHTIHKTIHRVAGDETSAAPTSDHSAHPSPSASTALRRPAQATPTDPDSRIIELRSTGIALSYDVTEIRAQPGEKLTLRFINASDMVHNIVLVKSEADITPVGVAAISAPADEFVPKSEEARILAASRLAAPGETIDLSFIAPAVGTYPYICTVSGHFTVMQGRLIVEP